MLFLILSLERALFFRAMNGRAIATVASCSGPPSGFAGPRANAYSGAPKFWTAKKKYSASSRFTRKAGVVRSLIRTTTAECSQYGPTKHRQCNKSIYFHVLYFCWLPKSRAGDPPPPPPPPRRACSCYWRPVASVMYTNIWKGSWFKLHRIRWYSVLQFL